MNPHDLTRESSPAPTPKTWTLAERDLAHWQHPLSGVSNELIYTAVGSAWLAIAVGAGAASLTHLHAYLYTHDADLSHAYTRSLRGLTCIRILCRRCDAPLFKVLSTASDSTRGREGASAKGCGNAEDPGGDVRLGTGLPHVVDRATKKRILEVSRFKS